MTKDSKTTPSDATQAEEEAEARAAHNADRAPTPDEERATPGHASPQTEESYQEATRLGANVKGEGELP